MNTTPLTFRAVDSQAIITLQKIGNPNLLNLRIKHHKLDGITYDLTDLNKNDYNDWNHEDPNGYSAQYEADKQNVNFHYGFGITLQKGQYLEVEGKQSAFSVGENDYWRFGIDSKDLVIVQGNVMALVNYAAPINNQYQFCKLFENCEKLRTAPQLPATILADACYLKMFENCYALLYPPALPANKLTKKCYQEMFRGCINLIQTPSLPAKDLTFKCYYGMFEGCIRLRVVSQIFAQNLATKACNYMFWGCEKIKQIRVHFKNWLVDSTEKWLNTKQEGTFYKFNSLKEEYDENRIPRSFKIIDLNKQPLTFTATMDHSSISLIQAGKPNLIDLYYCINDSNWIKYNIGRKILLKHKDIIQFKNNGPFFSIDEQNYYQFVMEGGIKASGKVESLINFRNLTCGCFINLFKNCISLLESPYMLYNTELVDSCYESMFEGCQNLRVAPILPATELKNKCYKNMFASCRALETVPALPAYKLANNCYESMFHGCSNIVEVPQDLLPATKMNVECYNNMFAFCTSLIHAPKLPSINLATGCYKGMFQYCESLKVAPQLPATILADDCYTLMFWECWEMYTAPNLPATKLTTNCYCGMFRGCSRLIFAPLLPAKELAPGCYENMFEFCHSLGSLTAYFEHWNEQSCDTYHWLAGTTDGGVFYHSDILDTDTTRDDSHIPVGWSEQSITTTSREPLTFKSIEENTATSGLAKITLRKCGDPDPINIKYRKFSETDTDSAWNTYTLGTQIILQKDEQISFMNDTETFSKDELNYYKFSINDGKVAAYGSVNSLIGTDELKPFIFARLFENCYSLVKAPRLDSDILQRNCYYQMFYNCTALENIPYLLALNLAPYCYQRMFYNCNSLVSIVGPDVPMAPYSCKEMFGSCSHLTHAILPSKYLAQGCYDSIFANCSCLSSIDIDFEYWWDKATTNWCTNVAQTGVFTKPIILKNDYSVNRIPFNWSIDLEAPEETPLTFKANGEVIFRLSRQGSPECELKHLFIRFNNNEWMLYEVGKTIVLDKDQIIQFRNYQNQFSTDRNNYYQFEFKQGIETVQAYGNIMSLVNFSKQITHEYQFAYLFAGCKQLLTAPVLPATTLEECCYYNMFNCCTALTEAPSLPATEIEKKVYLQMFANCYCLSSIPQLPAQELKRCCYRGMFRNCKRIVSASLPAPELYSGCYANMFNGCNSLKYIEVNFKQWSNDENNPTGNWLSGTFSGGIFVKPQELEEIYGINNIPQNWTISSYITTQPEPQPEPTPDPQPDPDEP